MFTAKKNIQLIDYQDSYYYRQQRKKRRYQWLKFSLLIAVILVALLPFFFVPFAQSNPLYIKEQVKADNTFIHGPQLLFDHPNPAMRATFPVDITANIEINGLVAYAEITQTFINPHAIALHGSYQFPLPESAAVKQLIIKIGDKEIIGEIMEKKAAQALYQQAKKQGQKASLVEQHRPNIFTNNIANIPAQSTVVVTLKFIMPVSFAHGNFTLRLPLAITPRYQPKSSTKQSTTSLFPHSHAVAPSQSAINIVLNSGIPITAIFSDSHKIKTRALNSEQNAYLISLNKTHVVSDKSFALSWQLLASEQPQVSSFTQEVAGEHYTLLTFFPPKTAAAQVIARDIIFIIDTSGSMQGGSMAQAKTSLQLALLQLNDKDSFNIIAFDDDTELLFPITQMASNQNITKAQQFIDNLNADGGTQMYRPLSNALMMRKNKVQSAKSIRQIVFITDGAVANEFELMQLLNSAQGSFRLYTVGIGAAPNGYFMKKAAQFGRGSYIFIQNHNEVQQKITQFMTKISQPAISNIALTLDNQVHQQVEVYPNKIPDLYFGEPLQIALKSQFPLTNVQLTGDTASTPWYQQLIINDNRSSKGVSSLWARRKIESLLDSLVTGANTEKVKAQVIITSVDHQIISPYTSFIALEKQPEISPLLEKNDLSAVHKSAKQKSASQKHKSNFIQTHQSLLVAMPQTAIGWQLQFLIGLALLVLALVFAKTSDFTGLVNRRLKRLSAWL
ncbi:MAG: marine proteobacterial sortase target protein [Colwellia sp.]|nr:marine proteobacterial sortase target protein [Colwellia sp.]